MYERLAPLTYDSLDEIPEPSEASTIVGHAAAQAWILSALESGKLPHALILAGPRGIGKASFAFALAAALVDRSLAPFDKRDPQSGSFRQIASGAHPGVLHLTRPFDEKTKKFKAVIPVEEARRVGRFLSLRTHDGGYRVVIVDPADDMNRNAANALLKNLEEPPPGVLFILISHMPGRLLPTIRSRAQMIRMHPLEEAEILEVLSGLEAGLPSETEARAELARRSEGSVRNALALILNGGLEIAQTLDGLITTSSSDHAGISRLADVVGGRDAAMQMALFNQTALDRLSTAASAAGAAGEGIRAERIAQAWGEATRRIDEAETYNLDRRQHVIGLVDLLRGQLVGA